MLGSLLASTASVMTVDGGIRQRSKFDNTRCTYNDRSYGVGASVGLAGGPITENLLALSYKYQELVSAQMSSVSTIQVPISSFKTKLI